MRVEERQKLGLENSSNQALLADRQSSRPYLGHPDVVD